MPSYGITHESGKLKRVLVHHPGKELDQANRDPIKHHFDQLVNIKNFKTEHMQLILTLREAGVEVLDVGDLVEDKPSIKKEVENCPNLVFTRDSSVVTDTGAILMRMGLSSRRKETPIIKSAYATLGIPIGLKLMEPETFEGGGFALLEDKVAVTGLCSRTTKGAIEYVKEFLFEKELIDKFIVLNVPPDDIHIDGDFAELPGKIAVVHKRSLDYTSAVFYTRKEVWRGSFIDWLNNDGWSLLEISDKERDDMAANFLTIDQDLAIHYTGNHRVMREVKDRGIDVIQISGDEMRKGNGGVHCMTCPILRL